MQLVSILLAIRLILPVQMLSTSWLSLEIALKTMLLLELVVGLPIMLLLLAALAEDRLLLVMQHMTLRLSAQQRFIVPSEAGTSPAGTPVLQTPWMSATMPKDRSDKILPGFSHNNVHLALLYRHS